MAHRSTHRHKAICDAGPSSRDGICPCPGCANTFAVFTEFCACGATRRVCAGMGAASLQKHVAHGYSRWGHDEEPQEAR